MFKKNSIVAGLLIGCIMPALAWLVFNFILHNDAIIMDKPGVPYLIAVGLNLLILRYVFKKDLGETAKGVMIITFVVMIAAFVLKINITR
ncbi:stationary phase survival protein SurE [Inquilinus sp. KBS0705]|nr:stationary phase survival protein SurE [Inquilinus sp. KBS0705]